MSGKMPNELSTPRVGKIEKGNSLTFKGGNKERDLAVNNQEKIIYTHREKKNNFFRNNS